MRTPKQIQNLRKAFSLSIGPFAFMLKDGDVNFFADMLQKKIDAETTIKWTVQIKMSTDKNLEWSKIRVEKITRPLPVQKMSDACVGLLKRYPRIVAIKATDINNPKTELIFNRSEDEVS